MNLRELIDQAKQPNETQKELAARLGINYKALNDAYNGKRGIPNEIALELTQLLHLPLEPIIAASELITEKDEAKRAKWRAVLERRAAAWIIGMTAAFCAGGYSENTQAAVKNDLSFIARQPAPDQAKAADQCVLCQLSEGATLWLFAFRANRCGMFAKRTNFPLVHLSCRVRLRELSPLSSAMYFVKLSLRTCS